MRETRTRGYSQLSQLPKDEDKRFDQEVSETKLKEDNIKLRAFIRRYTFLPFIVGLFSIGTAYVVLVMICFPDLAIRTEIKHSEKTLLDFNTLIYSVSEALSEQYQDLGDSMESLHDYYQDLIQNETRKFVYLPDYVQILKPRLENNDFRKFNSNKTRNALGFFSKTPIESFDDFYYNESNNPILTSVASIQDKIASIETYNYDPQDDDVLDGFGVSFFDLIFTNQVLYISNGFFMSYPMIPQTNSLNNSSFRWTLEIATKFTKDYYNASFQVATGIFQESHDYRLELPKMVYVRTDSPENLLICSPVYDMNNILSRYTKLEIFTDFFCLNYNIDQLVEQTNKKMKAFFEDTITEPPEMFLLAINQNAESSLNAIIYATVSRYNSSEMIKSICSSEKSGDVHVGEMSLSQTALNVSFLEAQPNQMYSFYCKENDSYSNLTAILLENRENSIAGRTPVVQQRLVLIFKVKEVTAFENKDMYYNILVVIIITCVVCVPLFLISVIPLFIGISKFATFIIEPINNLVKLVRRLDDPTYQDHAVASLYADKSEEIYSIMKALMQLRKTLLIANGAAEAENDSEALLGYSTALSFFQKINHIRANSVILSNIGKIHRNNKRFNEALEAYNKAHTFSARELMFTVKDFRSKKRNRSEEWRAKCMETIRNIEDQLIQLKFCIANTMYEQIVSMENISKKSQLVKKAIYALRDAIKEEENIYGLTKRSLKAMTKILRIHLFVKDINAGRKIQHKLESQFRKVAETNPLSELEAISQRFNLLKGDLCMLQNRPREAAQQYFRSITEGSRSDPDLQKRAFEKIGMIFHEFKLLESCPQLIDQIKRLKSITYNDIVILLDYSESMAFGGRIAYALKLICLLWDSYMRPMDSVGFFRFNSSVQVVFDLGLSEKNNAFKRIQVQESLHPDGESNATEALMFTSQYLQLQSQSRPKWVFFFTDGDFFENPGKTSLESIQAALNATETGLVMLPLGPSPSDLEKITEFVKGLKNSYLISDPHSADYEKTLQQLFSNYR